jgi:hypothetical protein
MKIWWISNRDIDGYNLETSREKQSKIDAAEDQAIVQTILRTEFRRKKFRVNVGNLNDMKKLLTT